MKKSFVLYILLISNIIALEYKDYFGEHFLKEYPKKVVYLSTYVEVPAMLGVWDQIVGISSYAFDDDIVKKTANLKELIQFPTDHYANIDVEKLKQLQVDLVVTYPANLQTIEFAQKFGINFLALRSKSIEDIFEHIRVQAKLFNKSEIVESKINLMQEVFDLIKKRTSGIMPKKAMEIFSKINQISGQNSMDSAILQSAKIENIGLRYIQQGRGEINLENVIKEDPEIIFLWWLSPYGVDDILKQPQLKNVRAIKNKQVFKLPAMDIAGPRTPLIALFIAMKSYPEKFRDIDFESFAEAYYKKMFD